MDSHLKLILLSKIWNTVTKSNENKKKTYFQVLSTRNDSLLVLQQQKNTKLLSRSEKNNQISCFN